MAEARASNIRRLRRLRAEHPELGRERAAAWRRLNRIKYLAHKDVEYAVKCGTLVRQPCERCGSVELIHAHHDDYSKPLDVLWLCPLHHRQRHREIGLVSVPLHRVYVSSPKNRTGFKGVEQTGRATFSAILWRGGQRAIRVSGFSSAEDAAIAYDDLARVHRGDKVRLNFPKKLSPASLPSSGGAASLAGDD